MLSYLLFAPAYIYEQGPFFVAGKGESGEFGHRIRAVGSRWAGNRLHATGTDVRDSMILFNNKITKKKKIF